MAGVELTVLATYTDELLATAAVSDYCPNGLQVEGRPRVTRLAGGVTASLALLDAVVAAGFDAVLVHHGYFWKGEDPRVVGMKRRRLQTLLRHDISLLAYHLPLDIHPQVGNNVQLALRLGLAVEGSFGGGGGPDLIMSGRPAEPLSGFAFAALIADRLGHEPLHIPGNAARVRRIAWCTGAGQGLIMAAAERGVDAFLTGEVSEQTVHIARETGLHFYAAGHHATERYGVQALGEHLATRFGLEFMFIDIPNPA